MKMKTTRVVRIAREEEIDFDDKFIPLFKYFEDCTLDEIWDKINMIEDDTEMSSLWDDFVDYCYDHEIISVVNNIGIEFFEE